eukprot:NODE_1219_length_2064_cov_39.572901_g1028_i0.p1 GENE.NODE_1219_length_2064_cov_39.572901_g1028_i0~~NODE_1219_length_2064_cov_39.572901_g1028_i0.p1  ORF type:complete len:578 (+),score=87.81 NODE_1219_length_2064_cov_39.572901_g1028_i0:204-1736(+)
MKIIYPDRLTYSYNSPHGVLFNCQGLPMYNLQLIVCVGVNRTELLDPIESTRKDAQTLLSKLTISSNDKMEENTKSSNSKLMDSNRNTIGTMAALLLVCLFVGLIVASLITKPIRSLVDALYMISHMDVDEENTYFKSKSLVREIRSLEESFIVVVERMREYKKYIPQALFESKYEESQEDLLNSSRMSRPILDRRESTTSSNLSFKSHHTPRSARSNSELIRVVPSSKKDVSIMVINCRRCLAKSLTPTTYHSFANQYITIIYEEVTSTGGLVDSFIGDSVMASWNAFRSRGDHRNMACKSAVMVKKRIGYSMENHKHFTIAITTGPILITSVGCSSYKTFALFGLDMWLGYKLSHLFNTNGINIVTSGVIGGAVSYGFSLRPIEILYLPKSRGIKMNKANDLVYELLGTKVEENDEWLYTIQQPNDPYDNLGTYLREAMDGRMENLVRLLKKTDITNQPLLERLKWRVLSNKGTRYYCSLETNEYFNDIPEDTMDSTTAMIVENFDDE